MASQSALQQLQGRTRDIPFYQVGAVMVPRQAPSVQSLRPHAAPPLPRTLVASQRSVTPIPMVISRGVTASVQVSQRTAYRSAGCGSCGKRR